MAEWQAQSSLCEERAVCTIGHKLLGEEKLNKVCLQPPWEFPRDPLQKSLGEVTSGPWKIRATTERGIWLGLRLDQGGSPAEMWSEDSRSHPPLSGAGQSRTPVGWSWTPSWSGEQELTSSAKSKWAAGPGPHSLSIILSSGQKEKSI